MRSALIFVFLLSGVASLQAQDIIVRVTGDTLHVKIDHANDGFVYYQSSTTHRGEIDVISRIEVSSILYNFEPTPAGLKKLKKQSDRGYDLVEGWLLYGAYYLPIQYNGPDDFKKYFQKLQFGWGFRGGLQIFVNRQLGLGLTYSQSRFHNSTHVQNKQTGQIGKLKNDIVLRYSGISLVYRIDLNHSLSHVELYGGMGYTWYSDHAEQIEAYVLTGKGITGSLAASININIGKGLYIPIKLAADGINIRNLKIDFTDDSTDIAKQLQSFVDNTQKEDVSRISATVGLLFSF